MSGNTKREVYSVANNVLRSVYIYMKTNQLHINLSRGGSCGCVGVEIHPRNLFSEKEKKFFILISDPAIILLK